MCFILYLTGSSFTKWSRFVYDLESFKDPYPSSQTPNWDTRTTNIVPFTTLRETYCNPILNIPFPLRSTLIFGQGLRRRRRRRSIPVVESFLIGWKGSKKVDHN